MPDRKVNCGKANCTKRNSLDTITQEIITESLKIEEKIKQENEKIINSRPPLVPYYLTIDQSTLRGKIKYLLYKYFEPSFLVRYVVNKK